VNYPDFFQKAQAVPLQKIQLPVFEKAGIELIVRRDDLFDSEISGNKFYKLFFNIEAMKCKGFRRLLTFGGAFSNHIHATAAAGKRFGFDTLGMIRGEKLPLLNPCLKDASSWGMQLEYLSREQYIQRYDLDFQNDLANQFDAWVVPEGGANMEGAKGMQLAGLALGKQLNNEFTAVCLASGTGTSLAGVAAGVPEHIPVYGFSVLKGQGDMALNVRRYFQALKNDKSPENWRLINGFHAGGYAKNPPPYLKQFWFEFENETGILLDPIYTLKLFWGIVSLVKQGFWKRGSRIIAIHSGGLQGRRGFDFD
jgi:1-aminocyclopropane-1-carboxylate deaminase